MRRTIINALFAVALSALVVAGSFADDKESRREAKQQQRRDESKAYEQAPRTVTQPEAAKPSPPQESKKVEAQKRDASRDSSRDTSRGDSTQTWKPQRDTGDVQSLNRDRDRDYSGGRGYDWNRDYSGDRDRSRDNDWNRDYDWNRDRDRGNTDWDRDRRDNDWNRDRDWSRDRDRDDRYRYQPGPPQRLPRPDIDDKIDRNKVPNYGRGHRDHRYYHGHPAPFPYYYGDYYPYYLPEYRIPLPVDYYWYYNDYPEGSGNVSAYIGAEIWAADGTFLGVVDGSRSDYDSIANTDGPYGSFYSPVSIFNPRSEYGSGRGALSPWDPDSWTPPRLFRRGQFVGYLTTNPDLYPRLDPAWIIQRWFR